ncbi:chorismate mutase [Candidatus Sumerlaeota bacterium]|nr:chorismate mutase [Candidatus Sumerlaeales bacterium]NLD61014.1 chorismate mutase [Candidatus Sumerlaeota bacterium]
MTGKTEFDMKLSDLRNQIDSIDKQILALLNQRTSVALEIGGLKSRCPGAAVKCPQREEQVKLALQALNQGPLTNDDISEIWNEIVSASVRLQERINSEKK